MTFTDVMIKEIKLRIFAEIERNQNPDFFLQPSNNLSILALDSLWMLLRFNTDTDHSGAATAQSPNPLLVENTRRGTPPHTPRPSAPRSSCLQSLTRLVCMTRHLWRLGPMGQLPWVLWGPSDAPGMDTYPRISDFQFSRISPNLK